MRWLCVLVGHLRCRALLQPNTAHPRTRSTPPCTQPARQRGEGRGGGLTCSSALGHRALTALVNSSMTPKYSSPPNRGRLSPCNQSINQPTNHSPLHVQAGCASHPAAVQRQARGNTEHGGQARCRDVKRAQRGVHPEQGGQRCSCLCPGGWESDNCAALCIPFQPRPRSLQRPCTQAPAGSLARSPGRTCPPQCAGCCTRRPAQWAASAPGGSCRQGWAGGWVGWAKGPACGEEKAREREEHSVPFDRDTDCLCKPLLRRSCRALPRPAT